MADATKQEVIKLIEEMPDDAGLSDILYELYVRSEIDTASLTFEKVEPYPPRKSGRVSLRSFSPRVAKVA